jgi:hypothetical protein
VIPFGPEDLAPFKRFLDYAHDVLGRTENA